MRPFRSPVVMARELATLDYLSGGCVLAVGIGVEQEREFHAAGVPFRERGRRTVRPLGASERMLDQIARVNEEVIPHFHRR